MMSKGQRLKKIVIKLLGTKFQAELGVRHRDEKFLRKPGNDKLLSSLAITHTCKLFDMQICMSTPPGSTSYMRSLKIQVQDNLEVLPELMTPGLSVSQKRPGAPNCLKKNVENTLI